MVKKTNIFLSIKNKVKSVDPSATKILYGSYARGDNKDDSDIDLLILLSKDYLSFKDKKDIKYSLYDIEFETGQIISPLVISQNDWESRYKITPFYDNIKREGIIL